MNKPKIALSLIVKDEEDSLGRCLKSVHEYVDDIFIVDTGSEDKTVEIAKEYGATVEEVGDRFLKPIAKDGDPVFHFDDARNYAFSIVPKEYDYILWLDADDVLLGAENLPSIVHKAKEEDAACVFMNYIYQAEFDEDGNIKHRIIEHLRERLVRNDGSYKWESHIHETLMPQRSKIKQIEDQRAEVLHFISEEEMRTNIERNIKILEQQRRAEEGKDPRTTYYLAKAYFDIRNDNPEKYIPLCKELLQDYLGKSGWQEERAQAHSYLAEIHRIEGNHIKSVEELLYALHESPELPEIYINLALSYVLMQEWDKALHWVRKATDMPKPDTTLIHNEKQNEHRVLEIIYHAALNKQMLDEAWSAAVKLLEYVDPDDEEVRNRIKLTTELRRERELTKAFVQVGKYLRQQNDIGRLRALVNAVPPTIGDNPILTSMRKEVLPPREWSDNEIAIYCGPGFEPWSPKSIGKGIGGSEEAVIYLSKELNNLGYNVTVYADPGGDVGDHDGVNYQPHFHFNIQDTFNILIGWRNIALFDYDIEAKQSYLWLHDIPNEVDFTNERLEKIDKIFVLSEWHRNRLPNVDDEMFEITANGINLDHFPNARKIKKYDRNPKRIIYTSSYDRGLEHLLKMWPDIREEVPDAELHVFYGWNLFDKVYSDNPERQAWKDKINKLMEQDGITHHGRVGQDQIIEETLKSGIWAYPTHFGEISCISAMKAQAGGAVPVVVDYAALEETVQHGVKVDGDIYEPKVKEEYKEKLIDMLNDTEKQEEVRDKMVDWALENFSWKNVARQWKEVFSND